HLQNQRAELKLIAGGQAALADNALAVDQRAVGAAQIAHQYAFLVNVQDTMLTADPLAGGAQVAFRTAAEDELTFGKPDCMTALLTLHDHHGDFHRVPSYGGAMVR